MNKEMVEQRLRELEVEKEQVRANFLALDGAVQDCKYWLNKCNEEPVKEVSNG